MHTDTQRHTHRTVQWQIGDGRHQQINKLNDNFSNKSLYYYYICTACSYVSIVDNQTSCHAWINMCPQGQIQMTLRGALGAMGRQRYNGRTCTQCMEFVSVWRTFSMRRMLLLVVWGMPSRKILNIRCNLETILVKWLQWNTPSWDLHLDNFCIWSDIHIAGSFYCLTYSMWKAMKC